MEQNMNMEHDIIPFVSRKKRTCVIFTLNVFVSFASV